MLLYGITFFITIIIVTFIRNIFISSEVKEECGLDVLNMEKIGVIDFEFAGSKELMEGHIYMCDSFSGDIVESDGKKKIKYIFFLLQVISVIY